MTDQDTDQDNDRRNLEDEQAALQFATDQLASAIGLVGQQIRIISDLANRGLPQEEARGTLRLLRDRVARCRERLDALSAEIGTTARLRGRP